MRRILAASLFAVIAFVFFICLNYGTLDSAIVSSIAMYLWVGLAVATTTIGEPIGARFFWLVVFLWLPMLLSEKVTDWASRM